MKKLLLLTLLLTACAAANPSGHPSDATQSEINMAEMMDISVEELRSQTPEEHMKMMQDMMKPSAAEPTKCEGSGCSCNIAQAPDAPKKGGCGCGKAACNKAS